MYIVQQVWLYIVVNKQQKYGLREVSESRSKSSVCMRIFSLAGSCRFIVYVRAQ